VSGRSGQRARQRDREIEAWIRERLRLLRAQPSYGEAARMQKHARIDELRQVAAQLGILIIDEPT